MTWQKAERINYDKTKRSRQFSAGITLIRERGSRKGRGLKAIKKKRKEEKKDDSKKKLCRTYIHAHIYMRNYKQNKISKNK